MDFLVGRETMSVILHPEQIKAELRMRYGSLGRFAADFGLNEDQVRDFLRSRSKTAKKAVAEVLGVDPEHLILSRAVPIRGQTATANAERAHGENAEAA
ncbi:MAG: helix-turn-helix domain-containing protein [Sphingomonadaceae bacterium]|nr:helix-turn-helix domain-containing protein [Sphingomonadaceae bacterium]